VQGVCRLEGSLSCDSELRELRTAAAGECTESEGLNSSRAVGGLLRKACGKSLKESEELSSGGIVPL
jgi:hypothetical protein